nr:protein SIEVE ELEMENT OCCLUSION C-like isoform X2 [Coffea arabica]
MSLTGFERRYIHLPVSTEEDFLIRKILMTHDPDGRQLDAQQLLHAVKNIIHRASPVSEADCHPENVAVWDADAIGLHDSLGYTIFKISHEVLSRCFEGGDIHTKTMSLFDMLGKFRWDAKVVLVVAAFFTNYGVLQLQVQLQSRNPLAALVALLRQVPSDLSGFRAQFKAFTLLVKTVMELTEVIIEFESLPLQQELLEYKVISAAKSKIYLGSYWIFRSSLACFSLIADLRTRKQDQVNSNSITIAAWTMRNLVCKLSALCCDLREQVKMCHQQIDSRLYEKLPNLFNQIHVDNQEKLKMLIASGDNFPLMDCLSKEKHSISELKNKVVILLISKPELLPIEKIFLLVHQTYDHPHQEKIGGSYVVLWVPLSSSHGWSHADKISFQFLSGSLPFWSLKQPGLLNSAVVNFIIQEWNFKEEAMMVVLDTNGMITNSNAMDMIWIWGAKAFPFSISREKELWEVEKWTLQLMIDGIDPLLTNWIEEGKNFCIFGSGNADWIRNFSSKIKEVSNTELQLEVIYVGWRSPTEKLQSILRIIEQENLCTYLTFTKIRFFWLRLESMKSLTSRQENNDDDMSKEILGLLEVDDSDDGWVLIGTGSLPGLIKLQGQKVTEFFDLFPVWAENLGTMGIVGAIKSALEPTLSTGPCDHAEILAFNEGLLKGPVFCAVCKRLKEKYVLYKCDATE